MKNKKILITSTNGKKMYLTVDEIKNLIKKLQKILEINDEKTS
jgi:hypothetical protein